MKEKATVGAVAGGSNPETSLPDPSQLGAGHQPTEWSHHWRQQLQRLDPLHLPLLPCSGKTPVFNGWQSKACTATQLQQDYLHATGVGTRTGTAAGGLVSFDLDGATAIERAVQHGCDSREALTWQVHRNTDPGKLKVHWRLTPEQQQQWGDDRPKLHTRDAIKDAAGKVLEKGQAVEVIHHSRQQVLVLGRHPESNGYYYWPERMGPEALAVIPESWWQLALEVARNRGNSTPTQGRRKATSSTRKGDWRPVNPCPICSRNTTDYCSLHVDGKTLRCFHGSTFAPPTKLAKGELITDTTGKDWAFSKTEPQANGDVFSVFVEPDPERTRQWLDAQWRAEVEEALAGFEVLEGTTAEPRSAPQRPKLKTQLLLVGDATAQLRERISEGISGTDLAQLVAELAAATDRPSNELQRIAERIESEQEGLARISAEAHALAAEEDRREISAALTPAYLLPATIAHALDVRTRYLPTDGPAKVLTYLSGVAGLVKLGTQVEASAVAGFRVPVNLYTALVAHSGAKKSPGARLLIEVPTEQLVNELDRQHHRELARWQEDCRGLKKDERPPMPQKKRLRITESNGEGLALQLSVQETAGLGLLIYRHELSGLFKGMNQYRGGRGSDEQQYLETYDGDGLTSIRVSGDRHYSRSQLAIYGTIQPGVLRQLVANGDDSGLWARFLFAPLPAEVVPLQQHTTPEEVAEVEAAAAALADACRNVYQLPKNVYKLSPAAAGAFVHYEANRQREALGATIGAQSALYGKSAGKVLRIAGLLHLLQIAAGEASTTDLIGEGSIERATALVDNLDAWALSFHAEVAAGADAPMLRTIHQLALRAGRPLRWKDIHARLSKKQRKGWDAASAHAAMEALGQGGYGTVEAGQRGCLSYLAQRPMH